ncbi:putative aminohydrolase SsnA [Endozoicomonas gorgoniicola]|uniref:Aminohydrolase SsnA n=1 Tax=Endozoicomonas gorgoniicola TaxID=1234144 RepID=A0ABT3MP54_9GAMM|nr:putative aminohydrolase SsnA [Endozoicomonas gorgoniicola]MCW7551155.1 putative aminohydrolase SsnA [Endozoicomonas gorgoniicola]
MLLIKNATAVQFQPASVTEGVDILIDGNKIARVGKGIDPKQATKVIDAAGRVVMPGIVCSHNHFYSGLSRGVMAEIKPCPDFVSTLKNLWWRLDRGIDEEILYYSGLICSLEAIKSGTTAVIDHHASPAFIKGSLNTLRQGFLKAGLRGMTCFETTDRNFGMKELEDGVQENIDFANLIDSAKARGDEPYLVEAHIGAHAPFTVPNDGLGLLADAVKETGRGLHIHVAEDKYDSTWSRHHYSQELLQRLDAFGLLNEKSLIAHGTYLTDADIELLNQRDGFLVHNPRSNMNNNVGYNSQLEKFKNVALGTDGIGSDMLEEMKFAFFRHRDAGGPLWPDSFLNFLSNGNRLLERNFGGQFGRLEPGYQADLVIHDYISPTPFVDDNLPGHLAFGMGSNGVRTVVVDGAVVYEDREFPFDVEGIYAEARTAAARLWKNMDNLD